MLNRSASLAMSTSVLKALPGKLDIKRHSPSILYIDLETLWDVEKISIYHHTLVGPLVQSSMCLTANPETEPVLHRSR